MLSSGTAEEFFASEFSTLDLGDKRLNARAARIGVALQKRPTSCIKRLCVEKSEMRQAYDFFSNPKVSGEGLLKAHYDQTAMRAREIAEPFILAIQDRTILDFTSHKAKIECGRINGAANTSRYGLFQHSTLLVTLANEPLGLIDVDHFDYDDYDLSQDRHQRSIEEKHSFKWIESSQNRRSRLGEISARIVTVADRESDIFEFLHDLKVHEEAFVIRSQHDRFTGEKYSKHAEQISALLDKAPTLGSIASVINNVQTRELINVTFHLKALESVLIPPTRHISLDKYKPISVNVVMAYNEEHQWIILTSLPVATVEDLQRILDIYKARWHIEDYHKILKTAYQIDEIYLHSSRQAITSAMVLLSISACRLYWIIYVGRVDPKCRANALLSEYEWKVPYVYLKEPVPKEPPLLSEVIIQIARMGGYKLQKNTAPPGIKSMWIGFAALGIASEVYKNVVSTKT